MTSQCVAPLLVLLLPTAVLGAEPRPAGQVVVVRNAAELTKTASTLSDGMTLQITSGEYPGGLRVSDIQQLTIEALDPQRPPVFRGGAAAWQFSRCSGLTVRNLRITGQRFNGLNLDDGGQDGAAISGITLEGLQISDIGPKGNCDGIKCSGLDQLTIRDCEISGWGGQGMDLVGCHDVLIQNCRLTGKAGFTATAGIQVKGGTSDVVIEKCRFENAGERPINVGGSTGRDYFRPHDAKYEARKIAVRENEIAGSLCAAAFVGVDGAEFVENTILYPEKWVFRILQENAEPGMTPCRNVAITGNRIVFRRAAVSVEVNIGPQTAPETFRLANNVWFAEDAPRSSRPRLPVMEVDGVYGRDPRAGEPSTNSR